MRCCARTKEKWKRCSNKASFIFCNQHKRGWWLRVSIFVFISTPSFILLYKGLYNELGASSNTKVKTHQTNSDSLTKKDNLIDPQNKGDININQTNTNGDNNATINNNK